MGVNNIMLDTDRRLSLWSVLRPGREVWISECVDPLFYYWWDQEVGVCKAQAQSNNRDLAISTSCSSDQSGSSAGHLRFYSWSSKANDSSGKLWKICRSPLDTFPVNNLQRSLATSSDIFVRASYIQPDIPRRNNCNGPFPSILNRYCKVQLLTYCRPELDRWESRCIKNIRFTFLLKFSIKPNCWRNVTVFIYFLPNEMQVTFCKLFLD